MSRRLEVVAHDRPAQRRHVHDLEAGREERAERTDVHLAPGDVLAGRRLHRIGLDGPRAVLSGQVDRARGQRAADALTAGAGAGHEAGDRPDARIVLVLLAALPRRLAQVAVVAAGRDRAPADRLAVEVRHQAVALHDLVTQQLATARHVVGVLRVPAHAVALTLAARGLTLR